jgi:hypothetical protein
MERNKRNSTAYRMYRYVILPAHEMQAKVLAEKVAAKGGDITTKKPTKVVFQDNSNDKTVKPYIRALVKYSKHLASQLTLPEFKEVASILKSIS